MSQIFKIIRNVIIKELVGYMKQGVYPIESIQGKPPYPYLTYNILAVEINPDKDPYRYDKEVDGKLIRYYQDMPEFTMSFNAYSDKSKMDAIELAHQMRDFFAVYGYEALDDADIIVVEIMPISDRTVYLQENYEFRVGFDVRFRWHRTRERELNTIETFKMKGELNG